MTDPAREGGRSPRLGIALGSGSARGWAHIGVLEGLLALGLEPQVIAGTSIGALVGAAYAAGRLEALKEWALGLTRLEVLRLLDARLSGGLMRGNRVMDALGKLLEERDIESLPIPFGAVATDMATGREIWLRKGSLLGSVRASSGIPGLFSPSRVDGSWLVDGGLVNPVPVSLCHALGAELVIGVDLSATRTIYHRAARGRLAPPHEEHGEASQLERLGARIGGWFRSSEGDEDGQPGILDVVGASLNIMQDRITRSRMVGEPPACVLAPQVESLELMDFHRAGEAIAAGRAAVQAAEAALRRLLPGHRA